VESYMYDEDVLGGFQRGTSGAYSDKTKEEYVGSFMVNST